jgi:hypothetical protein
MFTWKNMLAEIISREIKIFEFGGIQSVCLLQNTTYVQCIVVGGPRSEFSEQDVYVSYAMV